jgi:hypothetical protein
MSKSGFENEEIICKAINGKNYHSLNNNLKRFIEFCLKSKPPDSEIIHCEFETERKKRCKPDLKIKVGRNTYMVSVKEGNGNSVHQEKIEDFIAFLSKKYSVDDELKNCIRFFIWGDGTTNGTGPVNKRMNARTIQEKFPDKIKKIKDFFNGHKEDLIRRFILGEGIEDCPRPDFIYYGDENIGYWATSDDVVNFLAKNYSKSVIPVGKLTFQAWNRAQSPGSKSEKKRGEIQVKWPNMEKDMKDIMRNRNSI